MRRPAYIKSLPAPTYRPVARPRTALRPMPSARLQPIKNNFAKGVGTTLAGPAIAYGIRRIFDVAKRLKGFKSKKITPSNAGTTTSFYRSVQKYHPGLRIVKKTSAPQYYHVNASLRLNGNTGVQAVNQMELGLLTDLSSMVTTIPGYDDNTQAYLEKVNTEWSITNQSEATCYLDLYEVSPRYMSTSIQTPRWAFDKGVIDAGIGAAGCTTLGVMPHMSPAFTTMFKIHKRYRLELGQGQTHRHFSAYNMGYRWNQQLVDIFTTQTYNPRTTRFLMFVASGQPLNDSTFKTNVSTASTAIDVVAKSRYTWHYATPSSTAYKFSNFLPTITTESLLDVGSGEVETVQAA